VPAPPVLGRWQLHERIGAGRLAHVHRGRALAGGDGAPDADDVAIKLLAPGADLDDPAAEARFRREVAALAAIEHPGVIPLIGHGVDPDLGPYLVTPLIRGRTLRRLIAGGPTEPDLAALAGRELAAALAAIHAAGLVHRDLKPENVMIRDDGTIVVLDLGLAWAPHQTRYTEEGAVAGSVPYMAHEQIEGAAPTPATDVWAFGVILHEWIVGVRPFARGQPGEEVAAILAAARPPLAERDPRVAPPLAALVDACLSRRPADRPRDGAALAARLAALAPGDAAAALRDPEAFVAAEASRQAAALAAEARRLLAAGRPFAAAPLIARAARHRPDDPGILALADQVGQVPARRRRRWHWRVAGAALAAAVALAVALAARRAGGPGAAADAAAPPPLAAADLPEQAAADAATLEAGRWQRSKPILPHPPSRGLTDGTIMGSREDEVATTSDPEVARAYARELFGSSTRGDEGQRVLATALDRFPAHAPLWLLRGQVAVRLGRWDEAEAALTTALGLDPGLAAAWAARARLHRWHGRLRAAFADVEAGLQTAPDDTALLIERVALHAAAGRGAEARPHAARAAELAPTDPEAWIALADTSDDAEALDHLARAVRLHTASGPAWRRLCVIGARLGRPEAEHDCAQARVHWGYHDPEIVLAEAAHLAGAGDLRKARDRVLGTRELERDLRLVQRAAELSEALGDRWLAEDLRRKACALGDAASCPAPGPAGPAAP
jgi:eukaryotic-like serine/threonine-protein kinase